MMPNPEVKATPDSCACKSRIGHIIQRSKQALQVPMSGSPHLGRLASHVNTKVMPRHGEASSSWCRTEHDLPGMQ